jgi:hypothetical protein
MRCRREAVRSRTEDRYSTIAQPNRADFRGCGFENLCGFAIALLA